MTGPEDRIHKAVVQALRMRSPDGLVYFHVPNGGKRSARTGALMKALGTVAGVADLVLIYEGRTLFLELKAPGKYPDKNQREFRDKALKARAAYEVARSSAEAIDIIKAWGCPLNVAVAA